MDLETLQLVLQEASITGLGAGFLAGLIFAFNPMVFASIPVVLAYVTKAHEPRSAALMGSAFVAGLLMSHAVLGVAAALGGVWASNIMGRVWGLILGPILIVLGLLWPGWLNLRIPWFSMRSHPASGVWSAFLLGIPFTVALCPMCTPALLVTITASAAIGSVPFGLVLLLAFGVGRSVPILFGALGVGWLETLTPFTKHHNKIEVVGGVTLIFTGLYLLNEYFFII